MRDSPPSPQKQPFARSNSHPPGGDRPRSNSFDPDPEILFTRIRSYSTETFSQTRLSHSSSLERSTFPCPETALDELNIQIDQKLFGWTG